MIRKIRDFIVTFRFKKYGYFKSRLHEIVESYKLQRIADFKQLIRQIAIYMTYAMGYAQESIIRSQPARTKEEKQEKVIAIADTIIKTNLAAIKAYNIL